MIPIGPAPVTSTSSPTRSKLSAVCTALPNGSKIAAISSGMSSGMGTTFISGMHTYSAKEPGRFTPTPLVLRHRCPRPARQLRHAPQTICPSPETRCPIRYFTAAGPVSTISPTNSCPTTIGTGTVFALNSSHFQICTSVPQIADFLTLMSTSDGPGSGTGTRAIHSPGSGLALTSAFMSFCIALPPQIGAQIFQPAVADHEGHAAAPLRPPQQPDRRREVGPRRIAAENPLGPGQQPRMLRRLFPGDGLIAGQVDPAQMHEVGHRVAAALYRVIRPVRVHRVAPHTQRHEEPRRAAQRPARADEIAERRHPLARLRPDFRRGATRMRLRVARARELIGPERPARLRDPPRLRLDQRKVGPRYLAGSRSLRLR